jgi:hypothetical protein
LDPVNTDEVLVTEDRRDNLNTSCAGNVIGIHVYKWQSDAKKVAVPPSG